ncbi:hypothetical protein BKA81DRAFT_66849 [Phyllosticta paracitricarpa]
MAFGGSSAVQFLNKLTPAKSTRSTDVASPAHPTSDGKQQRTNGRTRRGGRYPASIHRIRGHASCWCPVLRDRIANASGLPESQSVDHPHFLHRSCHPPNFSPNPFFHLFILVTCPPGMVASSFLFSSPHQRPNLHHHYATPLNLLTKPTSPLSGSRHQYHYALRYRLADETAHVTTHLHWSMR